MVIRIALVCVAALLLAAHFLRWGNLVLVFASLALPLLLLVRRRWALRTVQAALLAGSAVWLVATYRFVQLRRAFDQPWGRLVLILGAVILLTTGAAILLEGESIRRRFPRQRESAE